MVTGAIYCKPKQQFHDHLVYSIWLHVAKKIFLHLFLIFLEDAVQAIIEASFLVDGQKLSGQHPALTYVFLLSQVFLLLNHVQSSLARSERNIISRVSLVTARLTRIYLLATLLRERFLWKTVKTVKFLVPY